MSSEYLALFKEIQVHCNVIYNKSMISLLTCPPQNTRYQQRYTTQATPD